MAARKKASAGPAPQLGHGEFVAYPGGPTPIYDLLERLGEAAEDSPDFGTPGISLDRKRLTVRWHGELPAPVRALLADPGFEVTVQQTPYRPGDLRAEAERLLQEHPGVLVAATARPEGDGIEVIVDPGAAEVPGGALAAATARGVASSYPLTVEAASVS